jgi:UPF0271 protein
MATTGIDLNCDLGEGYGPYRIADDEALLDIVSSANVACGFHAGDPVIMDATVRRAHSRGVDIGAHIGFMDVLGFGRRRIPMDHAELEKYAVYQMGALQGIAVAAGHKMTHVSFHGALGNMAAEDDDLADSLMRAVKAFDRDLIVSSVPNGAAMRSAERAGLRTVGKFLADRAYDDRGLLVSRKTPNSVIKNPALVAQRVVEVLTEGQITSISGAKISMKAGSILVHSDTPGAVALASAIRSAVESTGNRLIPLSQVSR